MARTRSPRCSPGCSPICWPMARAGLRWGWRPRSRRTMSASWSTPRSHLIDNPAAEDRALLDFVGGPDFPTGGVLVDGQARRSRRPMRPGGGAFRLRARIEKVVEKGGGWHLLVTEIPYGVQKGQADRGDRGADRGQETADPGRRARRERGGSADRARAALADGRCRAARGEPVQDDRAGGALPAQPQRARQEPHAGRDEPEAGADRVAGVPDRGAAQPVEHADRQDRRAAGAARRVPGGVPQPGPGDRDHPHRGRAQAGDDRRVRADRPAGRGDPQHAAAVSLRKLEEMEIAKERDGAGEGARGAGGAGREPGAAADPDQARPGGDEGEVWRRAADAGSRRWRRRRATSTGAR